MFAGVLATLVDLAGAQGSSEDLCGKCKRALKSIVSKLTCLQSLDALVHLKLPEGTMCAVLEQACDRRLWVASWQNSTDSACMLLATGSVCAT